MRLLPPQTKYTEVLTVREDKRIFELMDLVNTVATDLENDHPTPHGPSGTTTAEDPGRSKPGSHIDLTNSTANTSEDPPGRTTANKLHVDLANSRLRKVPKKALPTVGSKPRVKLLKMNVWFTEDDVELVRKISAARGQRPEDFIKLATLKLLAELGAVGEERKRLLIPLTG